MEVIVQTHIQCVSDALSYADPSCRVIKCYFAYTLQVSIVYFTLCYKNFHGINGIKHVAELKDGRGLVISRATCYYINMTWETYQYQTVLCKALNAHLQQVKTNIVDYIKRINRWQRMSKGRNDYADEVMQHMWEYVDALELLEVIK